MKEDSEARKQLVRDIMKGFELSGDEASDLADAMQYGSVMATVLNWELFVNHPRLTCDYATLAAQLEAALREQNVPARWTELLPQRLRPEVQYLRYRPSRDETWGRWSVSFDIPI